MESLLYSNILYNIVRSYNAPTTSAIALS